MIEAPVAMVTTKYKKTKGKTASNENKNETNDVCWPMGAPMNEPNQWINGEWSEFFTFFIHSKCIFGPSDDTRDARDKRNKKKQKSNEINSFRASAQHRRCVCTMYMRKRIILHPHKSSFTVLFCHSILSAAFFHSLCCCRWRWLTLLLLGLLIRTQAHQVNGVSFRVNWLVPSRSTPMLSLPL